jgi:cytochrome b subunit of formate dehydrogenase
MEGNRMFKKSKLALVFIMLGLAGLGYAQDVDDNQSCMECHADEEMTGDIDGHEISMFIDLDMYTKSIHGEFSCVDCHTDIEEFPHEDELEKVDCATCHDDMAEEVAASVHRGSENGARCVDCHGDAHTILPPSNVDSVTHHKNNLSVCLKCHGVEEGSDTQGTSQMGKSYLQTVHGQAYIKGVPEAANCVDCHGSHKILHSANPESQVNPNQVEKTCAKCHQEIAEIYKKSVHGKTLQHGSEDAATCTSCHGEHDIVPVHDEDSPLHHQRVSMLCGKCHFDVAKMDKYGLSSAEQETLFKGSVHAEEVMKGNPEAPNCVSCHGYHDTLALRDPDSPSNFLHVPETCGQCHEEEKNQYLRSVHGVSAMKGRKDSPVCTDCHGEHAILRPTDERSPVSFFRVSQNTCARCHASIVITDKYGINVNKVENFFDSYHGLALQHKSKSVANCASCHGYHLILHSSDPQSTVSKERLVETCGTCHPGIGDNVLTAPIHTDLTLRSKEIQAWVPRIYIVLIILVIGGMILHNGVIFFALMREKYKKEKGMASYSRFTTFEIIMHVLLTVTFILLAVTGFALSNPNSWWVVMLSYLNFTEPIRAWIHRVCGATMIATSVVYAGYMIFTKRGRSEAIAFFATWTDVVHVWQHLAYHLGWRTDPPQFDRYDYAEKMEFWALVWGVIIMAVTGLILWFPIISFQYLPKWAIDMAGLIHYYEAVLATLAIIIWHFFFVIFHPRQYPMSMTWLTGKMTKEDLKHHHPKEYERLERLEKEKNE